MKKICYLLCCFASLLFGTLRLPAAQLDSLKFILEEYTQTLESSPASIKIQECDFLISSCQDSAIRSYTAQTLFDYYSHSKVMNDEAVCVHLFDRWFASGLARFRQEDAFTSAKLYADIHRNTLLGMKAPALTLTTPEGEHYNVTDSSAISGALSLLYFYDSDCAVCKLYSKQVEIVLKHCSLPINIYTIYCGTDLEKWENYRRERLNWAERKPGKGRLIHLWDPEGESRFAIQYGVVSTPRLFLCDEDGIIIGRQLDPSALENLLQQIQTDREYPYGDEQSFRLFDELLPPGQRSISELEQTLQYFKWVAAERNTPSLYRHLSGDLMYYLSRQNDEESISACDSLIHNHILSGEIEWKGEYDSLAVVHLAHLLLDLHAKSAPGTTIPAVSLYVEECKTKGTGWEGKCRLDKLKKRCCNAGKELLLLFYDPSCQDCKEQLEKARQAHNRQQKIFLVNVEKNQKLLDEWEWEECMEHFDLSSQPYLILYDKTGKVIRRYFFL